MLCVIFLGRENEVVINVQLDVAPPPRYGIDQM